jgi:ubiquinone/menaquinone biosynthesis C-methylase UbiE
MTEYVGKSAYQGDIAARYDADRMVEPLWAEEQEFVRTWIQRFPANATILDTPVGTGRFLPLLVGQGLKVKGTDISADMVAEAHRQYDHLGPAVELSVGDAERLALPDQSVDGVISWRFFHLIPMPVLERVLREFRRVSRGPILVQVLQVQLAGGSGGLVRGLKNLFRPWYRHLRPAREQKPWSHISSFPHPEGKLRAAFQNAGLTIREVARMSDSGGQPVVVYTLER